MKKTFCSILLAIVLLASFTTSVLAVGKLTITKETFYVVPYSSKFAGAVYGEITNTGDKPITISSSVYEMYDSNDEAIASTYIYHHYPSILQPGEHGYFYDINSVDGTTKSSDIADYSLTFVGKAAKQEDVHIAVEARFEEYSRSDNTRGYKYYAVIENNTSDLIYEPQVVLAFLDVDGNVLYVAHEKASYVGLFPDSKIELHGEIDSYIRNQLNADHLLVNTVDAIAWYEQK